MDICIHRLGEINIPKEHRTEYALQALKLLCVGGMMTVEPLQLYGHKLYLLSPPEVDEEGKANGYNYLDNISGESWCLDGENGGFGCGKISGDCFYATVAAVHVLTTRCSTSYATTVIDGRLVQEEHCIGWIDHVLGTQYTNQRTTKLWEIGKLLHLDYNYWVRCNLDLCRLLEDVQPVGAFSFGIPFMSPSPGRRSKRCSRRSSSWVIWQSRKTSIVANISHC